MKELSLRPYPATLYIAYSAKEYEIAHIKLFGVANPVRRIKEIAKHTCRHRLLRGERDIFAVCAVSFAYKLRSQDPYHEYFQKPLVATFTVTDTCVVEVQHVIHTSYHRENRTRCVLLLQFRQGSIEGRKETGKG